MPDMTGEPPELESAVTDAAPRDSGDGQSFDAIVVGSGFGGSVSALRLAQAGFRVLLLERGRRFEDKDFPALPPKAAFLPDFSRWSWGNDQGLWDVIDLNELISVQAAGYGGGSLLYANVHLRAPHSVFGDRWPDAYRKPGALDEHYDLAAFMLGAKPYQKAVDGQIVKASELKRAATKLKRAEGFFHPPITVQQEDGKNVHGVLQNGCRDCGACSTGCPHRAKNSLDHTYLAVAEQYENLVVRTNNEVVRIRELGVESWSVECVDHLRAKKRTHRAKWVFLCAGAVHTTRLVQRATFLEGHGDAQELAGIGYFPGGDAIAVAYDTERPQMPSGGPTITTTLVRWEDPSSFFLIQDGGYAQELARLLGALRAPLWMGRNRVTASAGQPAALHVPEPDPEVLELTSPLDGVLDAITAGSFHEVMPRGLLADLPTFIQEIAQPLLLPAVVEGVIDRALRARLSHIPKWLVPSGGRVAKWLERGAKGVVRRIFGTSDQLAAHAVRAIMTGGDLPRARIAERVLNFTDERKENRAMLLAMGRDAAPGVLHYDASADRLTADLELSALAPGYSKEEQLMADLSTALGGEMRSNPAWAFLGKPVTVHNQGGCRMSDHRDHGVTDANGKVHGCEGLYVMDGAMLPTSVGVNPSATITAIAERNVLHFIRTKKGHSWPAEDGSPGAAQYREHRQRASEWKNGATSAGWRLEPPSMEEAGAVPLDAEPVGISFTETMQGYYDPTGRKMPKFDAAYRAHETKGRPQYGLEVTLTVSAENLAAFFEDPKHVMKLKGCGKIVLEDETVATDFETKGELELFVPRYKPYGIPPGQERRLEAQKKAAGQYTTEVGFPPHDDEREMKYQLDFTVNGEAWTLRGKKRIRNDPSLDAWRDTSSLFVTVYRRGEVAGAGVIHVDLTGFLYTQLPSMTVTGTHDAARRTWALAAFATFFFGSLQRIYAPGVLSTVETFFRADPSNVRRQPRRSEHS